MHLVHIWDGALQIDQFAPYVTTFQFRIYGSCHDECSLPAIVPNMSSKIPDDILADFTRSDRYHNSFLIHEDHGLESALKHSMEKGLPEIAVSPAQGKLMKLLAQSIGAKRILEVGTLGGYVLSLRLILMTCDDVF